MEFQFKLRLIRELEKKTYFLNESIDGFSAIDGTIDHSPLTQAPDRSDGYVLQNQSFNFLLLIDSSNVSPPPPTISYHSALPGAPPNLAAFGPQTSIARSTPTPLGPRRFWHVFCCMSWVIFSDRRCDNV